MSSILQSSRLILWCPYVHWYIGKTVASQTLGQMGSCKYQWMQKVIRKFAPNIFVYCEGTHTSMVHYQGDVLQNVTDVAKRKEISVNEAKRWNDLNDLQIPSDHYLTDPSQIEPNDIVFVFSSFFLDCPMGDDRRHTDLYRVFSRKDIFKVAHLTHYIFGMGHLARNVQQFNIQMLCFESNLAKYPFFKKHFPTVRSVSVIPFAIQDRFQNRKSFEERIPKTIVTGGISFLKVRPDAMEFLCHYGVNNFYPLRVMLSDNAQELSSLIHVKTGHYTKSMNDALHSSILENLDWEKIVQLPVDQIRCIDSGKKIAYYSDDIVAEYNNYRFSFVSDEVYHAPALGFFEALACGTVPIGIDDWIYRDVGLQKNINFVPFDGSFGGLLTTLLRLANNPDSVKQIVANNQAIKHRFSEDSIATLFEQKLSCEYQVWFSGHPSKVA